MADSPPEDNCSLLVGLFDIWFLNAIHFAICLNLAIKGNEIYLKFYVPTELLYGVGLIFLARSLGRYATAKGMIIATCVTALISGACAVALYT